MSPTLELAIDLINRPSVTPIDAGCQALICSRLEKIGFKIEHLPFEDVKNIWARRGSDGPVFAFAGHTDVVPTGPVEKWQSDPFKSDIRDGYLYGRGAADMKGSIAAMVTACERFFEADSDSSLSSKANIAFIITSDEEGPSINGTVKVIEHLQNRGEKIDWCLIGEPSCVEKLGDTVKNGRRGSLNGKLEIKGIQGHIAYPHLSKNPIHEALAALDELTKIQWDNGNEFFPPTSFQISNINAGTGATNVIPGSLDALLNFRYSTEVTAEQLQQLVESVFKSHELDYDIEWALSGKPFLTSKGKLIEATSSAIKDITGLDTIISTSGGTSDGRFIAPTGTQVVELGPVNQTIHKIDECVKVDDLDTLSKIYQSILEKLFA
ncbi:MAG: succinyl-diaminopimelate desuccinylase [Gammaproteobacteria bacterium]|nr:succinyl-diaminopimelate desuccinylase [Gammaproteobacteria bacterium]